MSEEHRSRLFDEWAAHYDRTVGSGGSFPFGGYEKVLGEIAKLAAAGPGMRVLDVGTGTGNLAKRFAAVGCSVWGTDFSSEMLAEARAKLPQASFVRANLLGVWPAELPQRFGRIVSAYVLHEFDLPTKISLLQQMAHHHLGDGGRIVVGDIAFPTAQAREEAHRRWGDLWDEDEHYWAADEAMAACEEARLRAQYSQISHCGGVLVVEPLRPKQDASWLAARWARNGSVQEKTSASRE
jgi:putative AdoMet-dependent methyltransferase